LDALCEGRQWQCPPFQKSKPHLQSVSDTTTFPQSYPSNQSNSESNDRRTLVMPDRAQTENFFLQKGMENNQRSEHLPPSQGLFLLIHIYD